MNITSDLPGGILFTIALICDILEGWQLVRGTIYETTYIKRRLPSWEILTNWEQPYPIIWIKEAIKINPPIDEDAINWSAMHGHTDIVKVLLEAKAPVNEFAIAKAAGNGHTEIVKLLLEAKASVDEDVICFAAEKGYLEIVKLLEAHVV